jgi:hypothetical protein
LQRYAFRFTFSRHVGHRLARRAVVVNSFPHRSHTIDVAGFVKTNPSNGDVSGASSRSIPDGGRLRFWGT